MMLQSLIVRYEWAIKASKVQPMNQRTRMAKVVSTYISHRTSKSQLFKGDEIFGPISDHSLRRGRNHLPKWANWSIFYSHSVDMSNLSRSDPSLCLAQWPNHLFIHIESLRSTTPVIITSTPSHQHLLRLNGSRPNQACIPIPQFCWAIEIPRSYSLELMNDWYCQYPKWHWNSFHLEHSHPDKHPTESFNQAKQSWTTNFHCLHPPNNHYQSSPTSPTKALSSDRSLLPIFIIPTIQNVSTIIRFETTC